MKTLACLLLLLGLLPAWAADKITVVTVDGTTYTGIQNAHVGNGGRIVILYDDGGVTIDASKLPERFLDSWGITAAQLTQAWTSAQHEAAGALDQAIRAGMFREVDGVVYDLRKPEAGWVELSGLKVLEVAGDGALVQEPAAGVEPAPIFVRNLPPGIVDNQIISVQAKLTQPFHFFDRYGHQRTIPAYDPGHVCRRDEIPEVMLRKGLAYAAVPGAAVPRGYGTAILTDGTRLRAIGSGFFVTADGYLLTNFHVVKDAARVEIKYQSRALRAKVVSTDTVNDLAVLKVEGTFPALAFSPRNSADLGDSVFTIGFPNVEMQGFEPKYTDGRISSLAGMQDDPSEYQISVPVQPGNSGGPLCDNNGEVVGVVVARLNDLAVLETSGVVPQNVNYAVKAGPAQRLLEHIKGVNLISPRRSGGAPVKSVEDAVAMIMIY